MFIRTLCAGLLLLGGASAPLHASEPASTPDDRPWLAWPDGLSGWGDPLRFLIERAQGPLRERVVPESLEAWSAKAPELRKKLAAGLGLAPLPEKTPLNARVTGQAQRDGYRIENVIYESRPGFYVTANVYIPHGVATPAPAVVVGAGHAMEHGKNHDLYQLGQLGLVRQGLIVLAFDPIGQGERNRPGYRHDLGYGSLLVGQTNEGYIVWDAIRSVDYLLERGDVDPARIGIAGNSGGGELVFYAMPLDPRIQVGASFCFVCSYDAWIERGGNHCICNHLPGLFNHMEQFEIIGLNAPRAFLAGNGTEDKIFPIDGARSTIERARKIYALHDAPDKVASVEAPMPHGWSQPLREAGAAWMARWLTGVDRGTAIPEENITAEDPLSPDVLVLDGEPMPEDERTVVELNRERAESLVQAYAVPPVDKAAWEGAAGPWRERIWSQLGQKPADFAPEARSVSRFDWDELSIGVFVLRVEEGMEIGATLAQPVDGARPEAPVLFVGRHERRGDALRDGFVSDEARRGAVLVIDPRGTGESARNLNQIVSGNLMTGRPLFAQQVWDVLQAARWLKTHTGSGAVTLAGREEGALLALAAAALEPGLFTRLELTELLASYRFFIENEQPQSISLTVPGILEVADVPQLLALALPLPIHIDGLIGYGKTRLASESAARELEYPRAIEDLVGATGALTLP